MDASAKSKITLRQLRNNMKDHLDFIIETGEPVEFTRFGVRFKIIKVKTLDKKKCVTHK